MARISDFHSEDASSTLAAPTKVVHCKKEPFDVYIGRPSKWGNQFSHKKSVINIHRVATREDAVRLYREWLLSRPDVIETARRELRGKVLGCWCKPLACHGDVLAEIIDRD